jgi:hypothetical protein
VQAFRVVFHVELRRFPHNTHAFNLSEAELRRLVLDPWSHGDAVELGERRWRVDDTRLTILEGPELASGQLSMGRGWAAAVRHGHDVTGRLLSTAASAPAAAGAAPASLPGPPYDAFLRALLGLSTEATVGVDQAWRLANLWYPSSRVSDRLVVAERAVRDLLGQGLAVLCHRQGPPEVEPSVPAGEVEALLLAWESWVTGERPTVFLRATTTAVRRVD